MSAAEAESTKEMAFNQGFYNLFLAVVAAGDVIGARRRAARLAVIVHGADLLQGDKGLPVHIHDCCLDRFGR